MVQFQDRGHVVVLNLACRRVLEPHTAVNIKRWFSEILTQFEIDESRILAFTCDSAANIQLAAKMFLEELHNKSL